jgi:hypothetical protein
MATEQGREPITPDELNEFTAKLDQWGQSLPPKQRGLLQVLLARAAGSGPWPPDVSGFSLPGIAESTNLALQPLTKGIQFARPGWIKGGDPWAQGA